MAGKNLLKFINSFAWQKKALRWGVFLFLVSISPAEAKDLCPKLDQYQKSERFEWKTESTSAWVSSSSLSPKGIVLVVHGLNNKPSVMDEVINVLTSEYLVLKVSLAGHRGDEKEAFEVTNSLWINEARDHLCIALNKGAELNIPVYGAGFSLGGLLLLHGLSNENHNLKKLALFSPAIDVPWYASALKLLRFLSSFRLLSWAPEEFRAEEGTTAEQYTALFQIQNELTSRPSSTYSQIPIRSFVDLKDKVIDVEDSIDIVKSIWPKSEVIKVRSNENQIPHKYHLLVRPEAMSASEWQRLKDSLLEFFES